MELVKVMWETLSLTPVGVGVVGTRTEEHRISVRGRTRDQSLWDVRGNLCLLLLGVQRVYRVVSVFRLVDVVARATEESVGAMPELVFSAGPRTTLLGIARRL